MRETHITGLMSTGKSALLLNHVAFNSTATVVVPAPAAPFVTSRRHLEVRVPARRPRDLTPATWFPSDILVDEGQFLCLNELIHLRALARDNDVNLTIAYLSSDFRGRPWPIARALATPSPTEHTTFLTAECTATGCGRDATVNARFVNGHLVTDGELVSLVKADYRNLCLNHYREARNRAWR